jgi:hypothetical protein
MKTLTSIIAVILVIISLTSCTQKKAYICVYAAKDGSRLKQEMMFPKNPAFVLNGKVYTQVEVIANVK